MGYTFKKTLKASKQEREDIAKNRSKWREFQAMVERHRLVFLDESGLKTNMTRLCGRSGGRRCVDSAPCRRWETVTIISSVRLDGTTESLVFEGVHQYFHMKQAQVRTVSLFCSYLPPAQTERAFSNSLPG